MSSFKKCAWTPEEDMKLVTYIRRYGLWNWSQMPKHAGLSRSGKSCRLRWMNYLNPQIKRGNYTAEEDDTIINMRGNIGVGWSAIAARLPGRTDNEIKNRWHTHLKKRSGMKIIEPKMEEIIELEIDTTTNACEYSSSSCPETHYEHKPISSYILCDNASSNNNIVPPTYNGTSTDPHISFWTEPFSSENVYGDHQPTHVEQWPMPQDWFSPYDWCDSSWDYWFKLLAVGNLEDHQMAESTVIY